MPVEKLGGGLLGEGEGARQARRLDAEEVEDAVVVEEGKVRGARAPGPELRADARVVRPEGAVGEAREVGPDGVVEGLRAALVDVVEARVAGRRALGEPLDVGAELDLALEVDGGVDAQAAVDGERVDEAREGRGPADVGEVRAPREERRRRPRLGRAERTSERGPRRRKEGG